MPIRQLEPRTSEPSDNLADIVYTGLLKGKR